jgi:hypothetical protein
MIAISEEIRRKTNSAEAETLEILQRKQPEILERGKQRAEADENSGEEGGDQRAREAHKAKIQAARSDPLDKMKKRH